MADSTGILSIKSTDRVVKGPIKSALNKSMYVNFFLIIIGILLIGIGVNNSQKQSDSYKKQVAVAKEEESQMKSLILALRLRKVNLMNKLRVKEKFSIPHHSSEEEIRDSLRVANATLEKIRDIYRDNTESGKYIPSRPDYATPVLFIVVGVFLVLVCIASILSNIEKYKRKLEKTKHGIIIDLKNFKSTLYWKEGGVEKERYQVFYGISHLTLKKGSDDKEMKSGILTIYFLIYPSDLKKTLSFTLNYCDNPDEVILRLAPFLYHPGKNKI